MTAPVISPFGVAADSPLAAVSAGAHQVDVFFVDGRGRLAEAAPGPAGLAGQRAAGPAGREHLARGGELPAGPAQHGGRAGQARHRGVLPHRVRAARGHVRGPPASRGAAPRCPARPRGSSARMPTRRRASRAGSSCPAPPSPGQPGSGPLRLDEARGPGGPWAAQVPDAVLDPAAASRAAAGRVALAASAWHAALWLARRRADATSSRVGPVGRGDRPRSRTTGCRWAPAASPSGESCHSSCRP